MNQPDALEARGVILDLDGVLYRGEEAVPGARQLLSALDREGLGAVALTNHSGRSPAQVSLKLADLGITLEPERIITSAEVAAAWCSQHLSPGLPVAVCGSRALQVALSGAGLQLVPLGEPASLLVVGYSSDLSTGMLNAAVRTLLSGAGLLGTNPDMLIPDGDTFIPETGPLIRYLEAATDRQARILGKPHGLAFSLALQRLGLHSSEVVMVGDTLHTDVAGASALGLRSIWLNHNGESARQPYQPTRVASDLQQVLALLV